MGLPGNPASVLVFEHVTGGGLAGRDLPPSWASEGRAMLRAIVADFAALPGVRVMTTVDPRVPFEPPEGVEVLTLAWGETSPIGRLAGEVDFTLLIAPESDDILRKWADLVEASGGRSLGSSPGAVRLAGDKAAFARHLIGQGIPTPTTLTLDDRKPWPGGWDGPVVIKPRWGAGSLDTLVLSDLRRARLLGEGRDFIAQPYLPGEPRSASFLVDAAGRPTLLSIGRQRIEVDESGRISYLGGVIEPGLGVPPDEVLDALDSVVDALPAPSLLGFVGVDYLVDESGRSTVLEINPRPTTSFVGLTRVFPAGTIAGAWLAAVAGPLAETGWPNRLQAARESSPPVAFDADGTVRPSGADPR